MNTVDKLMVLLLLLAALLGLGAIVTDSQAHAEEVYYEIQPICEGYEDASWCKGPSMAEPDGEVGLVYGCVEGGVSYELTTAWADPGFPIEAILNGDSWISTQVDNTGIFFVRVSLQPGDVVEINGLQLEPIRDIQCAHENHVVEDNLDDLRGSGSSVEPETAMQVENSAVVRTLPRTGLGVPTLALLAAVLLWSGAALLLWPHSPVEVPQERVTRR